MGRATATKANRVWLRLRFQQRQTGRLVWQYQSSAASSLELPSNARNSKGVSSQQLGFKVCNFHTTVC